MVRSKSNMAAAPQNRAHLAAKRDVIRKRLAQAVRLFSTEEFENFAFFKQLKKEDIEFNAFKVADGLDVNIQLPVSLQDIGSLKQHFINNASKPTAINLCTTPLKLDLSELVIQQLGLPLGLMNVQASPSQLILHDGQTRQKFCWPAISPVSDSKLVTGKVILQLPVEGGHEGGALKVDYNGRNKMFENDRSSDQCFYVSAFYNFCTDVMKPLKKGSKLILVFNLVWTNDNAFDIRGIPVFLTVLRKTKTALEEWLDPNSLVDKKDLQLAEMDDRYERYDSSESDEFENFCLSNETFSDDVLYFVLEESYAENNLTFGGLRGRDEILAQILKSTNIVDVHLACAALVSFNMEYGGMSRCATEDQSLKITRWIDSNDVVKNLNMELNWDEQRVGPIRNLLKSEGMAHVEIRTPLTKEEEEDLEETCYMPLLLGCMPESRRPKPVKRKQYFYRGVLVIWPKTSTPLIYCRYGMNSLLEEMEKSLNSVNPEQEETRKEVLLKVQKIVSFCLEEPNKAWNYGDSYQSKKKKNTMERGELTLKLLRMCITLKAREEGLVLLKALGSSFLSGSHYEEQKKFEGIQTEAVAEAIADFVHQVAGWDDCAELIKIITSPYRISDQLAPIIKLAEKLQDVGCLEGAKLIGECLVSSVVNCLGSNSLSYDLLNGVASSFVWATLDSDFKMKILNACTKQVEKLIADVNTRLKPLPGETEERFRVIGLLDKMCSCCQFFILSEKNRFDPQQKSVVQEFHPLLSKLPILIVMRLFLDIYRNESRISPSIKDFPILLDWYRTLCETFFIHNFFVAIDDAHNSKSEEIPSDIVKCLVWLNDEKTWQLFSQAMCRYTYQNNLLMRVLSTNLETQNAIIDSTLAHKAFVIIMDHWTKQLTTLKEPAFNWKQLNASLPTYPELQTFLRSDKETTVYSNFACIHEAKEFAKELEMKGLSNGFSVKVTTKGKRYSPRCTITKNRSFFSQQLLSFRATRLEMQKLSKQFNILCQNRRASTQ